MAKKIVSPASVTPAIGKVVIERPSVMSVGLEVTGTSDLIQNNFSQKSVEEMLRKHMGISTQREKKKPREVLEAATVRNESEQVCIPPTAFKLAMLNASASIKTFKKTQLRLALFVQGGSVPITYESMRPRMDIVRLAGIGRTPDVRFRPSFVGWKARLIIQFSDTLSVQSVVDLLNRAGGVGVGEWRPEKNGTFGTFSVTRHIDTADELAEVAELCTPAVKPLVIPEWALDMEIDPEVLQSIVDGAQAQSPEDALAEAEGREPKRNGRARSNGARA